VTAPIQDPPFAEHDEAPSDPPVERGLIVLPDGTELPFTYGPVEPWLPIQVTTDGDEWINRATEFVRAALPAARARASSAFSRVLPALVRFENAQRRRTYRGRHNVQRRWFGRARSTAEVTGAYHRNYRAGVDLREDDLPVPVYWTGWLYRLSEVLRAEDEALHPRVGHRFICS